MTDVPIQGILDHLVTRIADVLPGAAAGVTLFSAAIRKGQAAASSDRARGFEAFQATFREKSGVISVCNRRNGRRPRRANR